MPVNADKKVPNFCGVRASVAIPLPDEDEIILHGFVDKLGIKCTQTSIILMPFRGSLNLGVLPMFSAG